MHAYRRYIPVALATLGLTFASLPASALPTTINFDALPDLTVVNTQFSGLSFTNASVLSAGGSLNQLEFPPRSGSNVVIDDGGLIRISFLAPVVSVGAYFSYNQSLSFAAYDQSLNLISTTLSLFNSNLALSGVSGSSPNEFIGVDFAAGISQIEIIGSAQGFSFTMDDLSFDTGGRPLPVPGSLFLTLLALGIGGATVRQKIRRPDAVN